MAGQRTETTEPILWPHTEPHVRSTEKDKIADLLSRNEEGNRISHTCISTKHILINSMKFPKPRQLTQNTYDDWDESQPNLFRRLVNDIIFPAEGSIRDQYYQRTILEMKEEKKKKTTKVRLNQLSVNQKLFFMNLFFKTNKLIDSNIQCLVDTGAANSLVHTSVINRLGITYEPCKMTICTATGTDSESVKGIAHINVKIITTKKRTLDTCINFIVTDKLNGLDCIIGADVLLEGKNVAGLLGKTIIWRAENISHRIRIAEDADTYLLEKVETNIRRKKHSTIGTEIFKQCDICIKLVSHPYSTANYSELYVPPPLVNPDIYSNTYVHTIPAVDAGTQPNITINMSRAREIHPSCTADRQTDNFKSQDTSSGTDEQWFDCHEEIKGITEAQKVNINSHSVKELYEDETLPNADMIFADFQELKEEILTKKIGLDDGDFSECPANQLSKLKALLVDFADRFSESKLDLEITDLYTADLETIPGKIVNQKCRRLPTDRFEFAKKAIAQLMDMGVVSESDSAWRSNVVMVPKPQTGELRSNTKSDMLDKNKKTELYRICLDFRELNTSLVFPKQVQFVNLETLLYKLKGKIVVSMDISSAFFIIPIREEDRYKTAFWVNDLAYEFNCLVMGLKSSPYHLKMFMNIVFSPEQYNKLKARLSEEERLLIPSSFEQFIISYFDDCFVFADTYEQLYVCFKLCLMAAREAKIKFSMEKTSFFTTKIKVLGYAFDTKDATLTMDRLKSSAIANMKKPSSLFELHSRLCAFQYQSMFLPYLKHILYPLTHMLRKREWKWGDIEEEAWTLAKQLSSLGLRLTIPDAKDDLLLTTDASKVAASACLYRIRDNKLELVAVNSKYFHATDLNKCSYVLESIALAYGLKNFASYLLNCEGKIRIFTDARSLIYCKRNATHSILLNNTLNYLTNFVTLVNVEIYHLPGDVNVLADIMSRAIADNVNCALNREHPLSKQWASILPPIPDNFSVNRDTLFKFLTTPLKPELLDTHDRRMRKLMEPKSVQQWFDVAKGATSEERFFNALRLLEQWNFDYDKNPTSSSVCMNLTYREIKAREAHLAIITEKTKHCAARIEQILDKLYADIKNTPIYRKVRSSLVEASKLFLKMKTSGATTKRVENYTTLIESTLKYMEDLTDKSNLPTQETTGNAVLGTILNNHSTTLTGSRIDRSPINCCARPHVTWETQTKLEYGPNTDTSRPHDSAKYSNKNGLGNQIFTRRRLPYSHQTASQNSE